MESEGEALSPVQRAHVNTFEAGVTSVVVDGNGIQDGLEGEFLFRPRVGEHMGQKRVGRGMSYAQVVIHFPGSLNGLSRTGINAAHTIGGTGFITLFLRWLQTRRGDDSTEENPGAVVWRGK